MSYPKEFETERLVWCATEVHVVLLPLNCSHVVHLKSGISVETLKTRHLRRHNPNLLLSVTRQEHTGRQILLPTASRQPLNADSDRDKAITNAIEGLSLRICGHTLSLHPYFRLHIQKS